MSERNVLGGDLESCGTDPVTGFHRDGTCTVGPHDVGLHAICAVMTEEFLEHQRSVGNDLSTPIPEWGFPGLAPGDRWCVVAVRWLQAYDAGLAAPVVLASTSERALDVVPLAVLRLHSVDVPPDLSDLSLRRNSITFAGRGRGFPLRSVPACAQAGWLEAPPTRLAVTSATYRRPSFPVPATTPSRTWSHVNSGKRWCLATLAPALKRWSTRKRRDATRCRVRSVPFQVRQQPASHGSQAR